MQNKPNIESNDDVMMINRIKLKNMFGAQN
jgi:hypothetical protein